MRSTEMFAVNRFKLCGQPWRYPFRIQRPANDDRIFKGSLYLTEYIIPHMVVPHRDSLRKCDVPHRNDRLHIG